MPKGDKTGPPSGAKGLKDGRNKGKGRAPGEGAGKMTGGKINAAKTKKKKK